MRGGVVLSGLVNAWRSRKIEAQDAPFVEALRAEFGIKGDVQTQELRRGKDRDGTRSVYRVETGAKTYLVKLLEGDQGNGTLRAEYDMGQRLFEHFRTADGLRVPEPLFFSEQNGFFVLEFVDGSTADRVIQGAQDPAKTAHVFQQAGRWLTQLHGCEPVTETEFWPRFRLEEVKTRIAQAPGFKADPDTAQRYLDRLRDSAGKVKGRTLGEVFSHGDFWSSNLIVTPDVTCGLDFAYTRRRPVTSDFSEFLMVDLLVPCDTADLDPSGITRRHLELFLEGYGAEPDLDILRFVLNCKLVLEWLRFTDQAYEKRQGVRKRFHEAERRLNLVLGL